ncbi:hypothetical protein [Pseudidiomarina taiwanensis]|uniref:Cytochrome C n=1 Tax=Pseudidiomarina taiwanensis TaxID=337250 RepID=A0A432ZK79_9GAMM|nr:hypothetical protein [Pseudidiomarina taiwanensis]RUO78378.1 hypothetical protein CWI83_04935 [Pseudidiomarina taiwanensis]
MVTIVKNRRGSPLLLAGLLVALSGGAAPLVLGDKAWAASPQPSMLIEVSADTHDYIKYRMRAMLETYTKVSAATEHNDTEQVRTLIRSFLQANKNGRPANMDSELPEAFRAMNRGVMQQWREMATTQDATSVRQQSLQLLNTCNACHNTFALKKL